MKRLAVVLGAAAVLFLLQLAAVSGVALAEVTPSEVAAVDAGWEGAPILAQPADFDEEIERQLQANPDFQKLTPEQQDAARQVAAAAAGAAVVVNLIILIAVVLFFLLQIFICVKLSAAAGSLPQEHQQVAPVMAWLLLVPCVNIVMLFLVYPGLAKGFQSYFSSQGRTDVGDCGAGMVPWIIVTAFLCGPVYFVLAFMFASKMSSFQEMISEGAAA